jgi:hypothetical protein
MPEDRHLVNLQVVGCYHRLAEGDTQVKCKIIIYWSMISSRLLLLGFMLRDRNLVQISLFMEKPLAVRRIPKCFGSSRPRGRQCSSAIAAR